MFIGRGLQGGGGQIGDVDPDGPGEFNAGGLIGGSSDYILRNDL